MKNFILIALFTSLSLIAETRPSKWAKEIKNKEMKNFYQVDKKLYRSAQPSKDGFKELKKMGFTTVLNLREYHDDKREAKGTGIKLEHIKIETDEISYKELAQSLKIIKKAKGPILVHCWHGADRTGAVIASYRIVFQNCSQADAIKELKDGGYNYHSIYTSIPKTINGLDIKKLRKEVLGK